MGRCHFLHIRPLRNSTCVEKKGGSLPSARLRFVTAASGPAGKRKIAERRSTGPPCPGRSTISLGSKSKLNSAPLFAS